MRLGTSFSLTCLFIAAAVASEPVVARTANVDLPRQPLVDSLRLLGQQAEVNVLFEPDVVKGLVAPAVTGGTVEEALTSLLAGTGLRFTYVNSRTLTLVRASVGVLESSDAPEVGRSQILLTKDLRATDDRRQPTAASKTENAVQAPVSHQSDDSTYDDDNEIIVTGSHIRGARNSASPVHVYTRDDIDKTGAATVQEFVRQLPTNFRGGASEGTVLGVAGGGNANNAASGSGINLRGLGNDSTLVLVNGRRVAPGNVSGNFVDVSMIPLAAIDRIDIVPDGASAIYGSDAVGGVVNFLLRQDFNGAETRARYGDVADGNSRELLAAQTIGRSWETGSALLSYEYYDRDQLSADERSYTKESLVPLTLLPQQKRHGVYATYGQELPSGIKIFSDGNYSHRATSFDVTTPFSSLHQPANIDAYSVTFGGNAPLSKNLAVELSATYASSNTHRMSFDLLDSNAIDANVVTDTEVSSFDGKIDGSLIDLSTGTIKFAVGAQYRKERFESDNILSTVVFGPSRKITAGFVEFQIPLLPTVVATGTSALELSVADRAEHYSDFGSSNNPKAGLTWRPLSGLQIRSTIGSSFKAPLLTDLNPVPFQVVAYPEFDPALGANSNVLIAFGGNPNLEPEEATTWTLGFDWSPESARGLRMNATYYDVHFKHRIVAAQSSGVDVTDALRSEATLGPSIVRRNPSLAELIELTSSTSQFDDATGGASLSTITAIIDSRSLNLSAVDTSGIDLGITYIRDYGFGTVDMGIDATYILKFDNKFSDSAPTIEILNTPYNPVDLKVRTHVGLEHGPFSLATYLNYVNSYKDERNGNYRSIASWTTVDLTSSYQFGQSFDSLKGTSLALGITNITDAAPPFVLGSNPFLYQSVNFDGANANLLGRFYSFQLAKRW